jgi:uncharacterized protein YjbI with pentapeptide repeats
MKQKELDQLIAEHERWIDDRSVGKPLKLVNEDLHGLDLSGHWLSRAHFENVDLTGANLQKTRIVGAIITRVKFCEANMAQVDVSDSDINDVDFTSANLTELRIDGMINATNLKFDGAIMDEAFFVKSTFTDCSFKKTSLKSANFKRAFLDKCSLEGANLDGVDFTRAYLIEVDLRHCNVDNVIFRATRMRHSHVYGMTGEPAITEDFEPEDIDFSKTGNNSGVKSIVSNYDLIFSQSLPSPKKKEKKNLLVLKGATLAPKDPSEVFEEKDLYTTTEIIRAVRWAMDEAGIGMAVKLSHPIPAIINEELYLRFFLFVISDLNKDRIPQICAPFALVQSPINTYKKVEIIRTESKSFNLDVEPMNSLGDVSIVNRSRPFRGELAILDNILRWETEFDSVMDEILKIYPRAPETLSDVEKDTVALYFDLLVTFIQQVLLPAYRFLNPHFFDWLEAVLGFEVDPLLGLQNAVCEFYSFDGIPVKLSPVKPGEYEVSAMDMETGELNRDMSYLEFFMTDKDREIKQVDCFTEDQFNQYVGEVRQKIRKTTNLNRMPSAK